MARGKKKAARIRNPLMLDEKYIGQEPTWDKPIAPEQMNISIIRALNYYNYFYEVKKLKSATVEWIQKTGEFTPKQIAVFKSSSDSLIPMTVCSLSKMAIKGCPITDAHKDYINRYVRNAINETDPSVLIEEPKQKGKKKKKEVVAEVVEPPKEKEKKKSKGLFETIQDKIKNQANAQLGILDEEIDRVVQGKETTINIHSYLREKAISQPVASKLKASVEPIWAEIRDHKDDPQTKEAYASFKGKKMKRVQEWFESLLTELDNYIKFRKVNRKPRAKKVVSADKLVAKLKYQKEAKDLKLVSISPKDIIGAEQLWAYDTKTRKLFKYVADDHATLSVKGTTILNFNESESVGKTLRKPQEQLSAFMKAGKVELRKFLTNIRAVEIKAKSRTNPNLVLLKVL